MVFDNSKFDFVHFFIEFLLRLDFFVHILLLGILSASYSCLLFWGDYLSELNFMHLRKSQVPEKKVVSVKFFFYSVNYDALNH